jgi:uncharacterized membrane protein YeaQ/YmgE (transglycosylase-associated protein family)
MEIVLILVGAFAGALAERFFSHKTIKGWLDNILSGAFSLSQILLWLVRKLFILAKFLFVFSAGYLTFFFALAMTIIVLIGLANGEIETKPFTTVEAFVTSLLLMTANLLLYWLLGRAYSRYRKKPVPALQALPTDNE